MQGRQGKGSEPWDQSSSDSRVAANGTGKQRSIPRRPPGMPHVDQPPATPRIGRPRREAAPARSLRRRIIVRGAIIFVCAILAFIIAYGAIQLYNAITANAAPASTAT